MLDRKKRNLREVQSFTLGVILVLFIIYILNQQDLTQNPFFAPMIRFFVDNGALLTRLIFYVFLICGIILGLIVHWVGWDNIKFKLQQRKYRSKLICRDYYKEFRENRMAKMVSDQISNVDEKQLYGYEGLMDEKKRMAGEDYPYAQLTTDIMYKDGKLDGVFLCHYDNGNIAYEVSYRNGALDGPLINYYKDGRIHNIKHFKQGKLNGIFRAYDEEGRLFFEINYKNNLQHGPDKIYNHNGVLEFEDVYENGLKVCRKTFDEFGRVKFVQNYQE